MHMNGLYSVIKLMRINQPVGFFLLLWPTLWGLWISNRGIPDFFILVLFIMGVICMRSAGCVINDYIDRDIDSKVQRTKFRPIPTGMLKKKKVLLVFFILIIISCGLVLFFDIITILLAIVGLILSVLYPYLKRYIYLPQLILGILFSWPILMAYTATNHILNSTTWLLFIGNTIWTISYDTQYAMIDRDDDQCIGIKSSAILFGKRDKLIIGIFQLFTMFIFSIIGWKEQFSIVFYYFSLLGTAILFIWQQMLIFKKDRMSYFRAFSSNSYVGMLIFLGIMLSFY